MCALHFDVEILLSVNCNGYIRKLLNPQRRQRFRQLTTLLVTRYNRRFSPLMLALPLSN
jgi:hypothetical protein